MRRTRKPFLNPDMRSPRKMNIKQYDFWHLFILLEESIIILSIILPYRFVETSLLIL